MIDDTYQVDAEIGFAHHGLLVTKIAEANGHKARHRSMREGKRSGGGQRGESGGMR